VKTDCRQDSTQPAGRAILVFLNIELRLTILDFGRFPYDMFKEQGYIKAFFNVEVKLY